MIALVVCSLLLTAISVVLGKLYAMWWERRQDDVQAEEQRILEGTAILAGRDWVTDALNRTRATHASDEEAADREYVPRHAAVWVGETTDTFNQVVAGSYASAERLALAELAASWKCQSCMDDHRDCNGMCSCPCTLVEVAT